VMCLLFQIVYYWNFCLLFVHSQQFVMHTMSRMSN